MNPFLAEMYNTAENIGVTTDDHVKLAQAAVMEEAQLLDGLLADEGIDMDSLDGDTIAKVAEAVFGEESAIVKTAQEGEEAPPFPPKKKEEKKEEKEEESEEKMAEADFLGRMMAHAYVDELNDIEKEAAIPEAAAKALKAIVGKARGAGEAAKGAAGAAKEWATKPLRYKKGLRKGLVHPWKITARKHKGQVAAAGGLGALGLGGAGLGAAKALKGKEKKSSPELLDSMAENRALEILKEAGVEIEPNDEEKLAAAVEERAWQLLDENGFLEE